MVRILTRLLTDDSGQDLVEYSLLAGFIASAGLALLPALVDDMRIAYESWVTDVNAAWEPCPPGGCSE
jgi:Flp pilus assembly pilin Flp